MSLSSTIQCILLGRDSSIYWGSHFPIWNEAILRIRRIGGSWNQLVCHSLFVPMLCSVSNHLLDTLSLSLCFTRPSRQMRLSLPATESRPNDISICRNFQVFQAPASMQSVYSWNLEPRSSSQLFFKKVEQVCIKPYLKQLV